MRPIEAFLRRHALVRLFLVHTLIGYAIATLFVGALVVFNVGGLTTLVVRQHAEGFIVLLWFFSGLTFASVQMGAAIMSLADAPPPAGGKRARPPKSALLAAVRVARQR